MKEGAFIIQLYVLLLAKMMEFAYLEDGHFDFLFSSK